jgi:hypothetical protein
MTAPLQEDDLSAFEAKETTRKLPVGWVLLFWGLIVWGIWYLWAYTPALGGWSQAGDLEGAGPATGTTVLATIVFTAIPTVAAILIVLGQRRKRRA